MQRNIIISVPFLRNIRHSLSIPFVKELKKHGHIVVISPFKFTEEDIAFLDLHDAEFILLKINESFYVRNLLKVSDLIRRGAYFAKHNKHGMPYYFNNLFSNFNRSGYFEVLPTIFRFFLTLISFLFQNRFLWLKLEKFVFYLANFKSNEIDFLNNLKNVTYFQSANWGTQDRLLSIMSRKNKWNSVMIPYTSDQIHCTGFLLLSHNIYGVQSEYEKKLAKDLHDISEDNIEVIGSIWHRNIENFKKPSTSFKNNNISKNIMYAGVTSLYFPKQTELKSVKTIAIKFPKNTIYYCPYMNKVEFLLTEQYFKNYKNVHLIPHSPSMTELKKGSILSFEEDLKSHLDKISDIDIFVMSYLTSLSTDVNFLTRCPLIANFIDDYKILEKRNTDMFPKNMLGDQLKIASSYEDLIIYIEKAMEETEMNLSQQPYLYWDSEVNLDKAISKIMMSF